MYKRQGVPIGFLMAVFLSKVADRRAAAVIREVVDLLAGIPSVVYGLVGMMVLLPLIREGFDLPAGDTLFAAIIVLAIMILPSIISVSETALNACLLYKSGLFSGRDLGYTLAANPNGGC